VWDIILRAINWEITSMATPILLEDLKARREALEQEKEALDRLIASSYQLYTRSTQERPHFFLCEGKGC